MLDDTSFSQKHFFVSVASESLSQNAEFDVASLN